MLTAIAILEIGLIIKLMDEVLMSILMGRSISATGKTTSKMDLVWKHGSMILDLKVNFVMERSMDLDSLSGLMSRSTWENSTKT